MIKSIGFDIVEVSRIKEDIARYGERFINRILGKEELSLFNKRKDQAQFLAGRFAAKEAVIKGLGKYLTDRPALPDIQIINDSSGQPELVLPKALEKSIKPDICFISISHEKTVAAAMVVFSEEK